MWCDRWSGACGVVVCLLTVSSWALAAPPAQGDGGVSLQALDDPGLAYSRLRSAAFATIEALQQQSLIEPLPFPDILPVKPEMTGGFPGVVVWDYDGDGDQDLYVSNGLGAANSLFQNQLVETGAVTFIDVAAAAGLTAADQDSSGVCSGDLDNDGDPDLVVLGRDTANRLYENQGGGVFQQVVSSAISTAQLWSTSCTLGDVDGDGLLDLFVGNIADSSDGAWIYAVPFALNPHNQLFVNLGGLTFEDRSSTSGIEVLGGLPPGAATITWAVAMADVDADGDVDIIQADDQGGFPIAALGGVDRGLIHVLLNDGTGHFVDQPILGPFQAGTWMGISLGDLDCNGTLDLFVSNFGDYAASSVGNPTPQGLIASRWFLGGGDGSFSDLGTGSLGATAFGWGTAMFDYDNDADLDLLLHGGLDFSILVSADNPGLVHQNQGCTASFQYDFQAIPDDPTCVDGVGQPLPGCTQHIRRNVRGVAVGDLDGNGFTDVVTVANIVNEPPLPLIPAPSSFGSPLDSTAFFVPIFAFTPEGLVWTGLNSSPGDLVVELAQGNGNGWVSVEVQGSVGFTAGAQVNRDGVGAVLSFRPIGGQEVRTPVTAGSSHLSQHSMERIFGLGAKPFGRLEVLWPGGARNRLYGVHSGERLTLPEIPCSFDSGGSFGSYLRCVNRSLRDLRREGVIDHQLRQRLWWSAVLAFLEG